MAKLIKTGQGVTGRGIAKNDLAVDFGDLVAVKSGFVDLAVAGDTVVGISAQKETFASDNQTVDQDNVTFYGLDDYAVIEAVVAGATIAQANVGATYDLDANGDVDGGTSASGTQVTLVEVISDTIGRFVRAK